MPYYTLSILNVSAHHYSVWTKAVYGQTINWLLAGLCTAYTAVPPYYRKERLKEEERKRPAAQDCINTISAVLNIHPAQFTHLHYEHSRCVRVCRYTCVMKICASVSMDACMQKIKEQVHLNTCDLSLVCMTQIQSSSSPNILNLQNRKPQIWDRKCLLAALLSNNHPADGTRSGLIPARS
jgi:hypothetical protein